MYKPIFHITPALLKHISRSSELKSWIGTTLVDVTWLPRLQIEITARLTHSSTAIEGNPLTLEEVEALSRGEEIGTNEKSKKEVLNYLKALRWIWKQSNRKAFNEVGLLKLHKLITMELVKNPGQYKDKQNRVIDHKGHTVYVPPSAEKSPQLTKELIQWLNSKESQELHPIITCAIAHHRLVSIHPFTDGNGRIARAVGIWILYVRGFDTHHLFSLDDYFEKDRQKYYQKLQQVRDLDDDLTYWLEYVAEGVSETLLRTKERIHSLKTDSAQSKILLTKRQEDVLRFLRDKGRVRTAEIEHAFKITRSRLNQILKPLVEAGLVIREGQTRATSYKLK